MNRIEQMTIPEWISIPSNPIQRNTERRAKRATNNHLKVSEQTHQRVSMCVLPDGRKFKLDGHTRAYLWQSKNLIPNFDFLYVDVYYVSDIEEAKRVYNLFDNQAAVETAKDKVSGFFRELGFSPKSQWLIDGSRTSALTIAVGSSSNLNDNINKFINEIIIIDNYCIKNVMSGMVAAMLLTTKKRGETAMAFFKEYQDGNGEKDKSGSCPVQALTESINILRAAKKIQGVSGQTLVCSKAVSACEAYLAGRRYTTSIKSTDIKLYRS